MTFTAPGLTRDQSGHPGPRMEPAALRQVLADTYGLRVADLEPLGGETDQNLRATTNTGEPWLVRVSAVSEDGLAWQNSLLAHLEATAPDLPLPRLRRTSDGQFSVAAAAEDGWPVTVRVMSWLPGRILAKILYHPPALLRELGAAAGRLSAALGTMAAPDRPRSHVWDMRTAREVVATSAPSVTDPSNAANLELAMSWYEGAADRLDGLPHGVVHHDLNDANVLVDFDTYGVPHVSGIVDVGDALYSARVTELAIAVAYAMVRKPDPVSAAAEVVAGFHAVIPLTAEEVAVVYPLALARLCMNAATWSSRVLETGSEYGRARMHDTWPTLGRLVAVHPDLAEERLRLACGLDPSPTAASLARAVALADIVPVGAWGPTAVADLRPAADLFDDRNWADADDIAEGLDKIRDASGRSVLVLPHLRASLLRAARREPGLHEPATVQLGTGLLLPAGETLRTPLPATVEQADDEALVLRHRVKEFNLRTRWSGLSTQVCVGDELAPGRIIGVVSEAPDEVLGEPLGPGVWVQVVAGADLAARLPGFVRAGDRDAWRRVSPDPARLLGLALEPEDAENLRTVLASRQRHLASSQRNYYREPMNLVRGRDVWLYDDEGRAYLDSLNNVTHVGHAHPRVTAAAARQLRKLNTNSRFVYPQITRYTEKLVATLPAPLDVVYLVCTGSEANDLALRIARQVTGRDHVVIIDGAYHGNTGWVTGISPNRYKGPGGQGAPATTHEVTITDRYRGRFGYDDPDAGAKYAALARSVIDRISGDDRAPAAFIAESLMGSAGNIVHPPGYLEGVFAAARSAGALCISDEVQVGVGRLGTWWGFELQDVVPDIVTMGKPLGNGHPLAAVVTSRAIADAFDTGMKYFNTFGGNPVSCAIGEAVLDIVAQEDLRANALDVGGYFAAGLRELADRQPLVGDVRAEGLYLGVELVRDRTTLEPAREEAFAVTELAKEHGVIVFPNGVHDNVMKIKPPMTFRREHADLYIEVLDTVLSDVTAMVPRSPRAEETRR